MTILDCNHSALLYPDHRDFSSFDSAADWAPHTETSVGGEGLPTELPIPRCPSPVPSTSLPHLILPRPFTPPAELLTQLGPPSLCPCTAQEVAWLHPSLQTKVGESPDAGIQMQAQTLGVETRRSPPSPTHPVDSEPSVTA